MGASRIVPLVPVFYTVSFVVSVVLNVVLIYLIGTKSPRQLGVYKYLMAFISIFEIAYSLLDALLVPMHYSHDSAAVVFVDTRNKPFAPGWLQILHLLYFGFFGASLAIFAVHFIYRYLVVSANQALLRTFTSWKLVLWSLLPLSSGLSWFLGGAYFCAPDESTTSFLRAHVMEHLERDIDEFEYLGFYLYERSWDGSVRLHFKPIIGVVLLSGTIAFSLFIIVLFGTKCYQHIAHLATSSTVSYHSQSLHRQLFHALVIQTIIPVLLIQVPASVMFSLAFVEIELGAHGALVSMAVALYPVIDPLPNFFIIRPYRNALLGCFRCRKGALVQPHSSTVRPGEQRVLYSISETMNL